MVCLLCAYGSWFNVVAINWYIIIFYNYARSLAGAQARTLARECSVCGVAFGHRSPAEKKMRVLLMIYLMWDDHAGTYVRTYVRTVPVRT